MYLMQQQAVSPYIKMNGAGKINCSRYCQDPVSDAVRSDIHKRSAETVSYLHPEFRDIDNILF